MSAAATPIDDENPPSPLILVVDDQPINIQTLYQLLDGDYDIAMATSGDEALDYCMEQTPDLILLDVVMPGIDGYEVCRRLKADAKTRDIPIIFVTSRADPADEAEGLQWGAVDYITKPIVDIVVKARVRTQLSLKKARDDLARSQAELFQAEKMLALGRIVAGVAHEMATPVGNAMMTASTLQNENQDLQKNLRDGKVSRSAIEAHIGTTDECLALVMRSLYRAANLLETFKQVAIKDTGEVRAKFQLDELISDIVSAMSFAVEPTNVRCELSVAPEVTLNSYPGALGKALMGLIQNAQIHAYPASSNGVVQITGAFVHASKNADQWVKITVKDSGCGISSADQKRIFDPFHSTQLGRGGPGLGLSITWTLITQMLGGRIEVNSAIGMGTQFIITLPVTAPEPPSSG